jgi:hypothetical protein
MVETALDSLGKEGAGRIKSRAGSRVCSAIVPDIARTRGT